MMKAVFGLALVLQLTVALHAEEFLLTNGDRVTGRIIAADADGLRVKSDLLGEIHFKWKAVKSISGDQKLYMSLKDGRLVSGALSVSGSQVRMETAPGQSIASQVNQVEAIRSAGRQKEFERLSHPRLYELWAGSLDAGLSLAEGNTDVLTFTVDGKSARTTRNDRISFYYTSLFNRDKTVATAPTTANTVRSGARYDRNLGARLYGFGFTDFDSDKLQDLDLRNVLGGGFGWRVIKSSRTMLDVFSGGSFNQEYFSTAPDRKTGEILFGEELNQKLSGKSVLSERVAAFPNLSELGEYRASLDASATTKLNHWLNWQISVSDRFLSNPVPGTKTNDLLLTTGLGISFGQENGFKPGFRFVDLLTPGKD
ncbi:MAG: YdiY family protein [Actinomycetota bacterium]